MMMSGRRLSRCCVEGLTSTSFRSSPLRSDSEPEGSNPVTSPPTKKAPETGAFLLAETEGFEPSVPNYQYDGLANRWFQPLTHVSIPMAAGGRIARRYGGCNANSACGESRVETRTAPVLTRVTAGSLCRLHDKL
jgi:hypothetical protein